MKDSEQGVDSSRRRAEIGSRNRALVRGLLREVSCVSAPPPDTCHLAVKSCWHAACFHTFVVNKFGWLRALLWILVLLLPGTMLLLPIVLVFFGRRGARGVESVVSNQLPIEPDMPELAPVSVRA